MIIDDQNISRPQAQQIIIHVLVLIVTVLLSVREFNSFQLGVYMDDASYVTLAKSLVESDSYGLMQVPGIPLPTRYPFGFPLLLSPATFFEGQSFFAFKLVSLIATLLNSAIIFWGWPHMVKRSTYNWALAISALYAFSPSVIGHTRMVMSEPIFTTFILLSLILVESKLIGSSISQRWLLLAGGIASFACFIRTAGVAVFVASLIRLLTLHIDRHEKINRLGGYFLGALTPIVLVILATPVAYSDLLPVEYSQQLNSDYGFSTEPVHPDYLPRFFEGGREYISTHLRTALLPVGGGNSEVELGIRFGISNLPIFVNLTITILVILGHFIAQKFQPLAPTVLLFELLYLSIVFIWPWRSERFLYPILPFLFYALLQGVNFIIRKIVRIPDQIESFHLQLNRVGIGAFVLLLLTTFIFLNIFRSQDSRDYTYDLSAGTSWIYNNSESDSIVMAHQSE